MIHDESVRATSGDVTVTFDLDWTEKRWSSDADIAEASFPFVAEVRGKRYQLYSDGRFDEEELDSTKHG